MLYTEQEIRIVAADLIEAFDDLLIWKWEEDRSVLLAEFASGKADKVITTLQEFYSHEWDKKSIKKAPSSIKDELDDYAKLVKDQRAFTNSPQSNQKSVVALLWPWGHGSTLSLRLTLLETPYEYIEPEKTDNFFSRLFKKRKTS